jgi:hypothetical protein
MGLDTIMFYGTAAAAQAALSPTSAVIKGTQGDAYIVGYQILAGSDNTHCTLTCTTDPRWEPDGIRLQPGNADAAQAGCPYTVKWLPVKVPIKCGATLISTQDGADDCYCAVYIDYPGVGDAFKIRDAMMGQPTAFLTTRAVTAGGALTAFTISVNSTSVTTFQRGRSYTPVAVLNNGAMTTPFFVGIQNTKVNLMTFWLVPLTPIVAGTQNMINLPYGLGTVDGGETEFFHFLSTTAETPAARVIYAYSA